MDNAIVMIEHILHCLRGMTPERRAEEILFCRESGCSPVICQDLSWAAMLLAGYNEDDLPNMAGNDWGRVDEVCTRLLDWIEEAVNA